MNKKFSFEKKSFLWAFFISVLVFLPFIIYNGGIFVYMGDYNVQQIPFYKLAHEAVKEGSIFWNNYTDLGANFIGSYSFYLLFSPFFWLTLPFPTDFLPYLMGPLLILKTAFAALTSYLYIKRYVKDKSFAVLGSILYAFSGFMIFNIFFNHFHDVVVFFPLLMASLDELCENNKKGWFAFMVFVSAIVNYWFFIGEAVFVFIYVMIRIVTDESWRSWKKFLSIVLESVLGLAMACFVLIPSALAIMGNPRTGTGKLINGDLLWTYGFRQRLPAIITSFFLPPEIPSRPTFFPKMGAKWASLSAWLPIFSTIGTIAYCKSRKKDTVKRVIITSLIMSLVPVFNSAFVLFNGSYYARWFYMPILFLVIATAIVLEERLSLSEEIKSGFIWTFFITMTIILGVGLSPERGDNDSFRLGIYDDLKTFLFFSLVAVICLIVSFMLLFLIKNSRHFFKFSAISVSALVVLFCWGYIAEGKSDRARDEEYLSMVLKGREEFSLPDDEFFRTDFYKCRDNMGMMLHLPTIQAFHSIVPPSVMEFYPYVGIKRDVSSKPSVSYEALRPLTSVKYLFVKSDEKDQPPMEGYTLYKEYDGYNIYENDNFIPMGFMYDTAISREELDKLSGEDKVRYMLSAVCLEDDAIERNSDILFIEDEASYYNVSFEHVNESIQRRKENTAHYFKFDNRGFTAKINAENEGLVFFSVPYDKGWSAYVNQKEAVIEKANVGFMAVRVPKGESEIRFDYMTPGLKAGLYISAISLAVLILYLLLNVRKNMQLENLPKMIREKAEREHEPVKIRRFQNEAEEKTDSASDAPDEDTNSKNQTGFITLDDIKQGGIFKD